MKRKNISKALNNKSQIAVFGLGKFGSSIVSELILNNRNVFCCDINGKRIQELSSTVEHVIQADVTDDDFLESIGIGNFDVVVISFSKNFEDAVLAVMKLKEYKVPYVIAKASDERHKKVLEKIGADYVILPEVVMGERLANALMFNDPLTYIHESDIFNIEQVSAKKIWIGKSLSQLDLRNSSGINVLGIIRNDKLVESISSETVIYENDILIVVRKTGN